MKNLSIAFLAAVSLITFAGCKKKGGDAMAKMEEFKVKMCKCTDKGCADAVDNEMKEWQKKEMGEAKEPPKMSEEDTKKATEIATAYAACQTKAAPAAMTPPPAAPAGDKPADPAAPPAGDKPADPAAPPAAPPAGDKPAGSGN